MNRTGVIACRSLNQLSTVAASSAVTAGVSIVAVATWVFAVLIVVAVAVAVKGIAMQTSSIENFPFLVVNGNHLEEFLLVTFSSARRTLPSFQSGCRQF